MQREHRKTERSSNLLVQQRPARLEVRGRIWEAVILDLSRAGFGIWVQGDPQAETNEVVQIRTINENYTVRVASVTAYRDGYRLGLRLLEEVSPLSSAVATSASPKPPRQSPDESADAQRDDDSETPSRRTRVSRAFDWIASGGKEESAPFSLVAIIGVAVLVAISPLVWSTRSRPARKEAPTAVRPMPPAGPSPSLAFKTNPPDADPNPEPAVPRMDAKAPKADAVPDDKPQPELVSNTSAPPVETRKPTPDFAQVQSDLAAWEAAATLLFAQLEPRFRASARQWLNEPSPPSARPARIEPALIEPLLNPVSNPAIVDRPPVADQPKPEPTVETADAVQGAKAFSKGLRLLSVSNPAAAVGAFERASRSLPDDPKPRYFLAIIQYQTGDRQGAEQSLAAAVRLESTHPAPELGRLMQRIQGPSRLWMEHARRRAGVGPYQ